MQKTEIAKTVEQYLDEISYEIDPNYVPSDFAINFVNFIKLVNDGNMENLTPVVHFKMLDNFVDNPELDTINMCHRGIAKSTLKEYLILYLAVFRELPGLGEVPYAIYVSDSIENGVKKMRKSLEFRVNNSQFLQKYLDMDKTKFTDLRWEFVNKAGQSLVISGFGAKTGVRGTRENNSRPVLALLDDLISDEDARSPTIIEKVEETIYKAIDYALHPTKRKIIWSGTPFNAKDPLYKAVESGAWAVNVYPVCEKFPCTKDEFRGSWEDRFDFSYVQKQYTKAFKSGKVDTFNQELMLRIMSDDDRLIQDSDIVYYNYESLLANKAFFNYYITTDFATSDKQAADYSVISVWAVNHNGEWYWVDGICEKQTMDMNINDLFRLAQKWKPQQVGIEISGQQGGFIPWIESEMLTRNIYFNLASENNKKQPGIMPTTNKLQRFNIVVPWFKMHRIKFPRELLEHDPCMIEAMEELKLASAAGFKSKHDDFIDTISMLASMETWLPNEAGFTTSIGNTETIWEDDPEFEDESSSLDSYIV